MAGVDDVLEEEDEVLVQFLESEMLSDAPNRQKHEGSTSKPLKRLRVEEEDLEDTLQRSSARSVKVVPSSLATGIFSTIPPELFHHILKFLSSEDLVSCSLACRFMNFAASDEGLWRRLYAMRWGLASRAGKVRSCAWKKLYIQRDQEDMIEFIKNTPTEFKEYYIQMQIAKRSQTPLPSQVNDDSVILDRTIADQVSLWKKTRGLGEDAINGHICSGSYCTYSQIGEVFLCDRTGRVHVCDDNCREVVMDQSSGLVVCTISGHCFDGWLLSEEEDDEEPRANNGADENEVEPFMGSGRFARAYLLGYNCADERELKAALRFC